jgi:hypothetical protein
VFLYYPGYRQMIPKLRAFIDHVKVRSDSEAAASPVHLPDKRPRFEPFPSRPSP